MSSPSLTRLVEDRLERLDAGGLRRRLRCFARGPAHALHEDGARRVSFSCNDYLGLATHPDVIGGARAALDAFGAGAGASRLVTGNHPLLGELETRLAAIKGQEDALVFGSGYLANTGVIPAVMRPGDVIFIDELAHACIHAGARLSGADIRLFRHNDMAHLRELIAAHRGAARHAMVATDGVFSMDGDLAPLPELRALCDAHDIWLLVDDAHGLGVVGSAGRGAGHAFGAGPVKAEFDIGTLSKALGSFGGYAAVVHPVAEFLRNRARTFVYATGLPPACVGAALAALDVMAREPDRIARPLHMASRFCARMGLPAPQSAVVPVILGAPEAALAASQALADAGYQVTAIRPPTVPEGTARLRFAFGADHRPEDVDRSADILRAFLERSAPQRREHAR